ncbi:MAG: hypothetical protein L0G39_09065 [Chryseobacterium sp.]|nr:hypothetical protein [Chryseobacterium sp.]
MEFKINNTDLIDYIGLDFGSGNDKSVTVEIRFNPIGTMEVMDVRGHILKDESPFAYPSDDMEEKITSVLVRGKDGEWENKTFESFTNNTKR